MLENFWNQSGKNYLLYMHSGENTITSKLKVQYAQVSREKDINFGFFHLKKAYLSYLAK